MLWLKPRMLRKPMQTTTATPASVIQSLFLPMKSKCTFAIRFLEIPVENVRFSNLSLFMKCS